MANAFSVSHFTGICVFFNAPLFIAGNSSESAAGMGLAGKHTGAIKGHPQLPSDCYLKWSKLIPEYWSGQTIWAESALQAINASSNKQLIKKFNFPRLYAACFVFNPEYEIEINNAISIYNQSNSVIATFLKIKYETVNIWLLRFKFLSINISRKLNISNIQIIKNIENIEEASFFLKPYESKVKAMLKK